MNFRSGNLAVQGCTQSGSARAGAGAGGGLASASPRQPFSRRLEQRGEPVPTGTRSRRLHQQLRRMSLKDSPRRKSLAGFLREEPAAFFPFGGMKVVARGGSGTPGRLRMSLGPPHPASPSPRHPPPQRRVPLGGMNGLELW